MGALLCLVFILLSPLAIAGLSLIHQGLGRSRSAAHTMLATMCAMATAAIVFALIGSAWAGYSGGLTHTLQLGGVHWDWLGAEPFFVKGLSNAENVNIRGLLSLLLQICAVSFAAVIPVSTGSDRWKLSGVCVASGILAAIVYPLFSHAIWAGGWLAQLPATTGLPAFNDPGGAGTIQVVGGMAALSVAWVLCARRGKYADGMPSAIPGHNIVLVLFGCLLALLGWLGLDCAVSMLFYGAQPNQLILTAINAILAASAGLLAAVATTRFRYTKPDSSISANGWIAGLVAESAGTFQLTPGKAVLVGLLAGALVPWLVELFERELLIDDPGGAISVHAGAGLFGLLLCALLCPAGGTVGVSFLSTLIAIATLLGVVLPLIHALNMLANRFIPYRVDRDGDWQGMDIRELGSGAYPEFVTHADDFVPR